MILTRRLTAKLEAVSYTYGSVCVCDAPDFNESRVERKTLGNGEQICTMHVKFKEEKKKTRTRCILLLMPLRAINSRHETES